MKQMHEIQPRAKRFARGLLCMDAAMAFGRLASFCVFFSALQMLK